MSLTGELNCCQITAINCGEEEVGRKEEINQRRKDWRAVGEGGGKKNLCYLIMLWIFSLMDPLTTHSRLP